MEKLTCMTYHNCPVYLSVEKRDLGLVVICHTACRLIGHIGCRNLVFQSYFNVVNDSYQSTRQGLPCFPVSSI